MFAVAWLTASAAFSGVARELSTINLAEHGSAASVTLTFTKNPGYRLIKSGSLHLYVVDFTNAIFRETRQRMVPKTKLADYVLVSQYDRSTVRLVIKRDPAARVELVREGKEIRLDIRHPASGFRPGETTVAARPAAKPAAKTKTKSTSKLRIAKPAAENKVSPLAFSSREPSAKPRIVIDPGHGGRDPGAVGPHTTDKAVALAVGLQLKKVLGEDDRLEVFYTRTEDKFVALSDRGALAQQVGADLFISLHANSGPRRAKGYEVWYLSGRGSRSEAKRLLRSHSHAGLPAPERIAGPVDLIQKIIVDKQREGTLNKSSLLAGHLNKSLKKTGQRSRGVGEENFAVLRSVAVPSVLIELGFLSNPKEEKKLMSAAFQKKQATAIYKGIVAFLESQGRLGEGGAKTHYAVRRNDSLSGISQRFGVELIELAQANGLKQNSRIYVGQLLEIPVDPVANLISGHLE